ncbi:hypothetical protein [Paenibacillus thermotolerans]|uniref:hypothetical protein n=1 Tax=Paenibacillus thermotolerans TaxID=3027807 RepID=UPI002368DE64|nr:MULTISPECIES: hypothetical protein [unclassified Paenibacillus]
MKVGTARNTAAEWVVRFASREDWFVGAYFSGSAAAQLEDAELAPSSDIDVMIVTDQDEPPAKLGKFVYNGVLIEVTYFSLRLLASAEEVLTNYHLAGGFRTDTIIADPTGRLRELQREVSRHFAQPLWVRRRCENAKQRIEGWLSSIDLTAPLPDRTMAWLFPTGVTTHVLLVAALRNPTVRLRYFAVRNVLEEYGLGRFYPELLDLLGCSHLSPACVEHHLNQLARTFDAAAEASKTPFFFSTDITASARPIAIDGSRELIRAGYHREAVFWIVATFARCHKILAADAPDLEAERSPAFHAVLAELGADSDESVLRRAQSVKQFLPRLMDAAEQIIAANPDISRH